MKTSLFICALLMIGMVSCSYDSSSSDIEPTPESIYFPPLNSNIWETVTPSELGWNENQLQPLLNYLEEKHSKGFIILYNGKIVVEHYMNGHSAEDNWYWASAGKTLTTAITGIAQQEGLIDINSKVSDYLGNGWTSAPLDKENLITCKHLLSMTSGLDDTLGDDVSASNLHYVADAGERWAYHNVYVKLQTVIAETSNETWSSYFNMRLHDKIGMNGTWLPYGNMSVYWSTTRSMTRFGLMMSANGKWNDEQIVPESFVYDATNTSQNINEAYGYLWWLNGKNTYHLPQTQLQFSGELIPNAPSDMFAALGKNDQKIYVVPSKKLVIIRMGEAADELNFGLSDFDDTLWQKINALTN